MPLPNPTELGGADTLTGEFQARIEELRDSVAALISELEAAELEITNIKSLVSVSGTDTVISSNGNGDVYMEANNVNVGRFDKDGNLYIKGNFYWNEGTV